jgi:hypothetical protein
VLDEVIAFPSLETPIAVEAFEPSTPAAFKKPEQPDSMIEEPLSATADLLEALRRKRTEREDTQLQPHPETNNIRVIDFEPSVIAETPKEAQEINSELVSEAQDAQDEPKAPRKGRAAMPSWDEIVFGTKADD